MPDCEHLPDHRHGVGSLVDDDPTVAEFPFKCGVETHWLCPHVEQNPNRYGHCGQGAGQSDHWAVAGAEAGPWRVTARALWLCNLWVATMGMESIAGKFKIGHRIFTGFGIILIMLCAVTVISAQGFRSIDNMSAQYEAVSANAERIATINALVAEMRRAARLYGNTGDISYIDVVAKTTKKMREYLAEAQSKTTNERQIANIRSMADQLAAYNSSFDRLIILRKNRDSLISEKMYPISSLVQSQAPQRPPHVIGLRIPS